MIEYLKMYLYHENVSEDNDISCHHNTIGIKSYRYKSFT